MQSWVTKKQVTLMGDARTINDRNILALSICALLYFSFLLLNSVYFKIESTAIGVIQEIITIPVIIGQFVLLVLACKRFKRNNYSIRTWTFVSMLILAVLNCFVFVSFVSK